MGSMYTSFVGSGGGPAATAGRARMSPPAAASEMNESQMSSLSRATRGLDGEKKRRVWKVRAPLCHAPLATCPPYFAAASGSRSQLTVCSMPPVLSSDWNVFFSM
eukprot:5198676-Prymnesium_polylepis.1